MPSSSTAIWALLAQGIFSWSPYSASTHERDIDMKSYITHLLAYGLFGLFIATSCYGQNAESQDNAVLTETIKLNYRLAEEVIPLVKPFLHQTGIMSGQGQHILIKTSATNLAEIKQFISDLDVPLQNLLITVTIDDELIQQQNNRVKRYSTEKRVTAPSTQQVQTLEGQWATINTGELVPVGLEKNRRGGSVTYKSVSSGFQARARIHGKQVTIELRPKLHSKSRQGGGRISTQEADTTVSGQLGEWINIGGVNPTRKLKKGVRTYTTGRRDDNQNQIYVKVDVQK